MRKMYRYLSAFFAGISLPLIMPQGILAHTQDNDDIAHGYMGGGRAQPRGSGGVVRQGGGTYINRGGGVKQSPSINSQPTSPENVDEGSDTEEIPDEEEPEVNIHELPDFNLSNETPTAHTGDTVTLKVSDVQAQQPVTVFWRWGDDDWQSGGMTFQKTATQPGKIPVSVVIQDAEGLYSQKQTIEIEINAQTPAPTNQQPSESQAKRYYDMPPQDNNEPSQPPPQTDEQTAIDIFGATEVDKQETERLKKELESNILQLHQLEAYIEADIKIKADCEAKLAVAQFNAIGAETDAPLKEVQMYLDCVNLMKSKLKKAQEDMEKLKKNIDRLNGILS